MYLKSLEINGFKSFAKKAALSFDTPITGIVGPNGSGKSNVAESFRFVLGEQSIKSMRGKRGEDLIWNGADGGGKMNRASVRATFDNSKRLFNIDFDEVSLERVVHRDNTNEYLINGSPARLKDITELLAAAHIGASGHHIISQGEADRILSANIMERREMIEDALGLKIYQYKKIESQRKLEKTEENMKQVESLRREIAPHLKFLKKQVEKIEKAEEMRNELRGIYKEYFKREEDFIRVEKARIIHEKEKPEADARRFDRELVEAKSILEASKNKDAASAELILLENELATCRREKDEFNRKLGGIEGEIAAAHRVIAKEKEKHSKDEFKTVLLKDVEGVAQNIEELGNLTDAKSLFDQVKKLLRTFIASHRDAQDSALIAETEKEIVIMKEKKSALELDLKKISEKETAVEENYHALRQKIESEKDKNRDAEKNMFRIIAAQNEVRTILAQLKSREDIIAATEIAMKREFEEAYMVIGREVSEYQDFVVAGEESRTAQEERRKQIEKLKIRIEDAGGAGSGADVMKEFKETEERDIHLSHELADLEASKASLEKLIADLDARIDFEFKDGILKINAQFQQFFALMFGGGTASLSVVKEKRRKKKSDLDGLIGDDQETNMSDEETEGDEESREGLDISVNLPRKKVKALMMLSGGERALTSIALLFAISQVNPPPFIILDETDAALDEANSRKYGDMIESLSKYSQLILITHNRETMSRAGVLYGVTMGADGASKLLSIQFEEAVKVAK
ncbi:MAG: AAA family ATPase [Patescibacteria group bacterium]|nr:AAA family ATPase [Patescibacteria group bacterium]